MNNQRKHSILVVGETRSDLETLTLETPGTDFIAVPSGLYPRILTGIKVGKSFKKAPHNHLILPDKLEGYLLALWGRFRYNKSYDLWIEEQQKLPAPLSILRKMAIKYSKQIITRSKQLRYTMQQKGQEIRVIYPWIVEQSYQKRAVTAPYKLYCNDQASVAELCHNQDWNHCDLLKDADIVVLNLTTTPLNDALPEMVFEAVATRLPVVLLHPKPKKLQKRFGGISTVFPTFTPNLTLELLNDLVVKNIPFSIPKRYRFRYNLSIFKKILKSELPADLK